MNIFKTAYKVKRENSEEIYKSFGFKHLSDATQYYVHQDNESYKGTTTLCQPIGEAITLFSLLLSSIINEENSIGDFYVGYDGNTAFLDIKKPQDWRENGVVAQDIHRYIAYCDGDEITVSAYNFFDAWIDGDMQHLRLLYKLLPAFCIRLALDMYTNSDFQSILLSYAENPMADTFVNIHEDFYQEHKYDETQLNYANLAGFETEEMYSYKNSYRIIKENKAQAKANVAHEITPFNTTDFLEEYLKYVPNLPEEFVLPTRLNSVCSAVTNNDALAVLFHGPAGTGKTIACKLVCQAVGLPIMDTINCTENLDEFVLGKYIPQEDKIVFKESFVTKAIKYGGGVVFEEINFAKPQYLAFLNSLLDDNGFVRLDNGEVVIRHKNFRFFATMNLGYFGTKELNQSLYNRFNAIIEIASLPDNAVARMLAIRVPECTKFIDKILGVYHKIKHKIDAEELEVVISPRNLENWARLAKYEGYITAAEKTIIPIAKCDRVLEETIRGIIVLYKWS